jgi:predicted Zn-ribbon and HTH transcriptional regulator
MDDFVWCQWCGFHFQVVWSNDGLGSPEYCPRCGEEMDYGQTTNQGSSRA